MPQALASTPYKFCNIPEYPFLPFLSYFLGTDCLNDLWDECMEGESEDGNKDFHEPGFMLNKYGGGWANYTIDFDNDWTIWAGEQHCESALTRTTMLGGKRRPKHVLRQQFHLR